MRYECAEHIGDFDLSAERSGRAQRLLLQIAVVLACLVPLLAGGAGMIAGVSNVSGFDPAASADLDSHYRYLSGLLFGIGIGFLACVPWIERRSLPFQMLGGLVVIGGLARLAAALTLGLPGPTHIFALGMELGVVPALMLWQWRLSRSQRAEPVV